MEQIAALHIPVIIKDPEGKIVKVHLRIDENTSLSNVGEILLKSSGIGEASAEHHALSARYANAWMPLEKDEDLWFALDYCLHNKEEIQLRITRCDKKKAKASEEDSEEEDPDQSEDMSCKPNHNIYRSSDPEAFCAFCKVSSRDERIQHIVGPMYGPIKDKKSLIYVHELCAMWTPEVYLDPDTNQFQDLQKAIKRANTMKCCFCQKTGAGIGCYVKDCNKTYHYQCMMAAGCTKKESDYIIYCPDHAKHSFVK